ncbi:MAG: cation:proton antiporter [Thermodesulfobacteriota bacterium]
MTEAQIGALLLDLALLFALTYLAAGLLARLRIPGILGALFVAMAVHYTPQGERLLSAPLYEPFNFLAQFGVLFLLFYIGLQIDLKEMRGLSGDIVWLTILNTSVPFIFGMAVMLVLGYGWLMAFVIGLTRMPTAEAVIVPILDEFQLIRTRIGSLIVGAGTMDDIIEVFLVALVSVWIGEKAASSASASILENEVLSITTYVVIFMALAWVAYRWLTPWLGRWLPCRPRNLLMLSMLLLFGFGGLSEYGGLGMVAGAITAGVLMRPVFNTMGLVGEQTTQTVQSVTYAFFGLIFFFWVGLSADLEGILQAPALAILLYLAGTIGKLVGVFLMVPMKRVTVREAWTIGIGLDARLTTEIIVAKLLLEAKLIDLHLFTALVSAASFTAITVPLLFTLLIRLWGDQLRRPQDELEKEIINES